MVFLEFAREILHLMGQGRFFKNQKVLVLWCLDWAFSVASHSIQAKKMVAEASKVDFP
jgi:hypothetical protein